MGCGSSNDVSSPSTSIKSTSKNAYKYSTFTIDGPSRSFLQRQYDTKTDDDHEGVKIGEGEWRTNNTTGPTAPTSAQLLGGKTKSIVSTGTNTSVGTHLSVPYATHAYHNSNEGNNKSPLMFKTFKFPTEEELLGPQLASGRTSRATSGVTSPVPPPLLEGNSSTNSSNCKNEISLMGPNSLRLLAGAGGCFSPLAPPPEKQCSSYQMISVSGPPGAILSSIGSGSELGSCRGGSSSCSSTPKSKHLTTNHRDQPYQGSMGQATMILMLGAPGETGGGGSGFSNEDALVRGGMGRPSLGKIVEEPDPEDERREKEAQIRMAKLKAQKHEFCAFTEEVEQKQALRSAAVTGTQDSELGAVERRKQAEVEQWTQSLRREETPDGSSS